MQFTECRYYLGLLLLAGIVGAASATPQDPAIEAARRARDQGGVDALRQAIEKAHSGPYQSFDGYVRLALLEDYLCEAGADHNQNDVVKQAAQAGVAAARQAVRLNPDSSEAHWLLGSLLGQLIPYVMAGGMRYGPQSTLELEKAIQLDPKNAAAYVGRAMDYWFTPAMFGGSKVKAVEALKKAISLDPSSDTAATAHIWLAVFDLDQKRIADARAEINEALQLEPDRLYAQIVSRHIAAYASK
jgi:tetratricopeptide (TPR) repeat protein